MLDTLLLDEKDYFITKEDLPCFIHYKEGMGGSHLSIVLISQLISNGCKVLFFCAFPMGIEKLKEQVNLNEFNSVYIKDIPENNSWIDKQVILIESGNESLFLKVCSLLEKDTQRIFFVKNSELFIESVKYLCSTKKKIFLSGDLSLLNFFNFQTWITFEKVPIFPTEILALPKWVAYFYSKSKQGHLKIVNH